MKLFTALSIATLFTSSLHASKPLTTQLQVEIATPNPSWSIKIQGLHLKEEKLLVRCAATRKDGIFPSMMSSAKDSVTVTPAVAKLPREIYITGTAWNYSKGYTPASHQELKKVLEGSSEVKVSKPPLSEQAFMGLSPEEAQQLAQKHKLKCRIVEVDGKPRMTTRDYRPERLNFTTTKGKVTRVTKG